MYASSLRRDLTPLQEAQRASSLVDAGYSAYKLHSAVPGTVDDPADQTIATVTEVRRAVGDDVEILVDVNGAFLRPPRHRNRPPVEDLGVFHFEEPRPFYDLDGLAQVADALTITIASGEMIFTHHQYRDLIVQGEWTSSSRTSSKFPASPSFSASPPWHPLSKAHHRPQHPARPQHRRPPACCCRILQHPLRPEYNIEPISIRDQWPVLKDPLQVQGGCLRVPDGPGLGVELDDDLVDRLARA